MATRWTTIDPGGPHINLTDLFGAAKHDIHRNLSATTIHCIDIHTNQGVYRVHSNGKIEHHQPEGTS